MKSFFWKFMICIVPVAICGWAFADSLTTQRFFHWKKGVDLSGGTILVYEVDTRKLSESLVKSQEGKTTSSETEKAATFYQRKSSELASALKQRIDPTSAFDIKIRPAGTEGRVEIIIPTGDPEKVRRAEAAWKRLMDAMNDKWKMKDINVPRGRLEELVDQIQQKRARELWETELLNNPKAWDRLVDQLEKKWESLALYSVPLDPDKKASERAAGVVALAASPVFPVLQTLPSAERMSRTYISELKELAPVAKNGAPAVARLDELISLLSDALEEPSHRKLEADIREYAWKELIVQLVNWDTLVKKIESQISESDSAKKKAELEKQLKWLKEDLDTVPVDGFQELVGRVQTRGDVVSQAGLDAVQTLIGDLPNAGLLPRQEIEEFIAQRYGPSTQVIEKSINEAISPDDLVLIRDPSLEDVQRVKDLVSKVGALEFKMLANHKDDAAAIKDIMEYINRKDPAMQEKLEQAAVSGQPPPVVPSPNNANEPKRYKGIKLARGAESELSYSWVELGKQERRMLGFSNDARTATGREQFRNKIWLDMQRDNNMAVKVKDPRVAGGDKYLWEGALFYRRECKDRNLPEKERRAKKYEYFVLARNPEYDPKTGEQTPAITGTFLRSASTDIREGRPAVSFTFTPQGGELFGILTGKNVPEEGGTEESQFKRHLSIILDGLVMSAPTINSKITHSGQITGDFTRKEVDNLVNILRSGALPATLKPQPVSETTIAPLLGQDTINDGFRAIIIAFIMVVVFMVGYYRFAGLVACVALFANLILTVGFMVMVQATFTLPGLAGLVLMLGMAVDANVLIYERLREERDRGASLTLALRNGYERALPTIIDTHLTSIFTAIVLYAVGTDQLKGFAISLAVGLIISLFTSLYMTHVIFNFWQANGWLRKLSMGRLLSKPNINFMGVRNYVFTATSIVTVLGLILFLARTPNDLDIDFKGGTAFTGKLKEADAQDVQGLRHLLEGKRQEKMLKVKSVTQNPNDPNGREYTIVYAQDGQPDQEFDVILANTPDSPNPADPVGNVKLRASELPDWSVEQIFYSKDLEKAADASKSRFFTVRTSEKERGLVYAMLVRLFRNDQGQPLLDMNKVDVVDETHLTDKSTLKFTLQRPATVSYLHTALQRQLEQQVGKDPQTGQLNVTYQIVGSGQSVDNAFKEMQVVFNPPLKPEQVDKVRVAVNKTMGALAQAPQPERLENFDSELASDTRTRALIAIFVSWVAIVLYLWFRFGSWTFGLAAVLCLVHDLCFTLGFIAASVYLQPTFFGQWLKIDDFKIDLNGVAALLTLVGYSVADTIVVFDRIREVRGKNPELTPKIINDSINQTLSRTLLTSFVTFVVVLVLYWFGGPGVHLFAFIMTIGVVIGTLSSIYVASPLLLILGEGQQVDVRQSRRPAVVEAPA